MDGATLTAEGSLSFQKEGGTWKPASAKEGLSKRGRLSGPFRDIFHEPVLFVYGASDPTQALANEEVARAFANPGPGIRLHYPMMSDVEFIERGEKIDAERALFLVGSPKANQVLRELEHELPVSVQGNELRFGDKRYSGPSVGTALIYPNPKRSDQYVAVIASPTAQGIWRALSLPNLLPDYVVYDERLAPARGQMVIGHAETLAAGLFDESWGLGDGATDPSHRER